MRIAPSEADPAIEIKQLDWDTVTNSASPAKIPSTQSIDAAAKVHRMIIKYFGEDTDIAKTCNDALEILQGMRDFSIRWTAAEERSRRSMAKRINQDIEEAKAGKR